MLPVRADETVTLTQRQFAATSPAAPFQGVFTEARRLAAATTPVWPSVEGDLAAWGPALIFPLLDTTVPTHVVLGLAAPLAADGTAPQLMFRTLGLYAAKSRVPFADTPALTQAINRNLNTLEHTTADLETFAGGPGMDGWGSIGAGAWLAYLELLYRDYGELGNPGATRWNADGLRIVDELLLRGRMPDGKGFRTDPRADQRTLWPNVLMLYALVQAYESAEQVKYESAAVATADVVEALRAADGGYSSSAAMADKDTRANAYLAGALLLLWKDTGETHYRERALGILHWLSGAAGTTNDAALRAHGAYLILLADSLSTQRFENLIGRRPMRVTSELGAPSAKAVDEMAQRLRPADFRYRAVFDAVLHTLLEHAPQAGGDFAYDYGDAPGYAARVLLDGGDRTIAPQIIQREQRLLSWPRPRDFDEISFGADALLAAIDHPDAVDAAAAQRSLRRYLLLSDGLAFLDRYYFDWLDWLTDGGGFEYGPTVLGAQIAATHLRFAEQFRDQSVMRFIHPLAVGRALIDAAGRRAWDAGRHVYRARPQDDTVWLLPNVMMIVDLLHTRQLTGDATYMARAEEVAAGLDALWDDARGAYFASSAQMGDDAYESLSTNSYAALALLRLFATTQKPVYRERALRVFDFIAHDLYADGIFYHHLSRGRRATGDIWCTGCNWRMLSALMELDRVSK